MIISIAINFKYLTYELVKVRFGIGIITFGAAGTGIDVIGNEGNAELGILVTGNKFGAIGVGAATFVSNY